MSKLWLGKELNGVDGKADWKIGRDEYIPIEKSILRRRVRIRGLRRLLRRIRTWVWR